MKKKIADKISRVQDFFKRDLWTLEPSSLSNVRRGGLKFLRICALVIKGFKEDHCPIHASALTFISVMAMVPFLTILFAIAKAFRFEKASQMLIDQAEAWPTALQEAITTILKTVESASAGAMAGFGIVLVLWVAIKMLSNIEETFNTVWGVKDSRTLIDKIRNYIVIIVITPILLIVATTAQPVIIGFASKLEWMGPFLKLGLQSVPVLTMTGAFCVVYLFLPNTKVKIGSAFIGALVAALLSVAFQFLMIYASVGISRNSAVYGTLAAIPIFLFWVQTSWIILLMGAEVAFSVQNAGTYSQERLAINPSTRSRLCLAFALMKKTTSAFENDSGPFDTLAYGLENRIPVRLINNVIHILSQNGLVTEASDSPGCYTLLRPPENITARLISDAIINDGADPQDLGLGNDFPLFGKITDESFQTLEKQVLKSF